MYILYIHPYDNKYNVLTIINILAWVSVCTYTLPHLAQDRSYKLRAQDVVSILQYRMGKNGIVIGIVLVNYP